jgi:tetratricopeptide (TPR) repeat protein
MNGESVAAQQTKPATEQVPPEEDEDFKKTEYTLNPLQSKKEFEIGQHYWRKGAFEAAKGRWQEAVSWDAGNSEALYHLGLAQEKLGLKDEARETWTKYLGQFANGKRAGDVTKRLKRR